MMSLDRRRKPDEPKKIVNLDSWAGYEAPRERILSRMAGLKNNVVLTGDEHQNFCGDLVSKDRVVGAEFVAPWRSEEHTSELQSLMRISYAVFCLKKKNNIDQMKNRNGILKNNTEEHSRDYPH